MEGLTHHSLLTTYFCLNDSTEYNFQPHFPWMGSCQGILCGCDMFAPTFLPIKFWLFFTSFGFCGWLGLFWIFLFLFNSENSRKDEIAKMQTQTSFVKSFELSPARPSFIPLSPQLSCVHSNFFLTSDMPSAECLLCKVTSEYLF